MSLNQIRITHPFLMDLLDSFTNQEEILKVFGSLKKQHKEQYEISLSKKQMKQIVVKKVEGLYNYQDSTFSEPKAYWVVHLSGEVSTLYFGTQAGLRKTIYSQLVTTVDKRVFPSWVARGKVVTSQNIVRDQLKYGDLKSRQVEDYDLLEGEVIHLFFQYLQKNLRKRELQISKETVNSIWKPEQLGLVTTTETGSGKAGTKVTHLDRSKRISYKRTSIDSVVLSTPVPSKNHREPNPSDRRDWRPDRVIPQPNYEISWTNTLPVENSFDATSIPIDGGETIFPEKKEKVVYFTGSLAGEDIFG